MTEKVQADWRVELNCDCPKCKEYVDIMEFADFWDWNSKLQIGEHGTERADNVQAVCPECGHEFIVECVW